MYKGDKLILISHRGNTSGADPKTENEPNHIVEVLDKFNVEVDVWFIAGNFYLGHDAPQYPVDKSFLCQPGLWCHAKNTYALEEMSQNRKIHYFWHQNDDFVITSKGYIWASPGNFIRGGILNSRNFVYMTESLRLQIAGICTDQVLCME